MIGRERRHGTQQRAFLRGKRGRKWETVPLCGAEVLSSPLCDTEPKWGLEVMAVPPTAVQRVVVVEVEDGGGDGCGCGHCCHHDYGSDSGYGDVVMVVVMDLVVVTAVVTVTALQALQSSPRSGSPTSG